jgi:hypothetical protein
LKRAKASNWAGVSVAAPRSLLLAAVRTRSVLCSKTVRVGTAALVDA